MSSGQGNAGTNTTGLAPTLNCLHEAPIVTIPIQNATRGKNQNGLGIGQNGDPQYTLDQGSQHAVAIGGDIAHTLTGEGHDASEDGSGRGTPVVAFHPTQDPISSTDGSKHCIGTGSRQGCCTVAVAFQPRYYLRDNKTGGAPSDSVDITNCAKAGDSATVVAFQPRIARNGRGQPEEIVPALNGSNAGETSDMRPCVAIGFSTSGLDSPRDDGLAPPVKANLNGQGTGSGPSVFASIGTTVRRLTPRECERLQSFPDDWSGQFADSTRYKMCGNAVTVNVILWLAKRIKAALE